MGIIRKVFFVFVFLSTSYLSAKITTDTVFFDGNIYVKHIVKAGESIRSIANLHHIQAVDIIENNEINKHLYYNQLLYIPIFYNNQEIKSKISSLSIQKNNKVSNVLKDTSVMNIALLMPYFLIKNEAGLNNFKESSKLSDNYFKDSEVAFSFHIGVELALDSLRKQGKNIRLHTFDTNKDTLKVHQIVNLKVLDKMDIIIGPLYANNFRILCDRYGNDTTKILISPLSKKTKNVKKNKAVYQLPPSFRVQINIIKDYVLKHHMKDRVVVLNQNGNEGKSSYIKHLFKQHNKVVETFTINDAKVDLIRKIFTKKQVVIIHSENKAFVSKILGAIGGLDSTSFVFGMYDWKKYNNLDIHNLMFLDVKFPDAYNFNKYSNHDLSFLSLFEKKYNTNLAKYTHCAYNTIMHFCSDFSYFKFINLKDGGKTNTYAPLHHYVDYELFEVE